MESPRPSVKGVLIGGAAAAVGVEAVRRAIKSRKKSPTEQPASNETDSQKAHERARIAQEARNSRRETVFTRLIHSPTEADKIRDGFVNFNLGVEQRGGNTNPSTIHQETNAAGVAIANEKLPGHKAEVESLSTPSHEYSPTLLEEIEDQQRWEDPKTGQGFNAAFLNREALNTHPDNAANVYFGPYLNVVGKDDEARLRMLQLAHVMPDRALISFDYPGQGGSDPLTDVQKDTSKKTGFNEIADAQLRSLKEKGIDKINVFGISQGGFASATLAARAREFGITVEKAVIIGSPGVDHTPLPVLGVREAIEGADIPIYHASPPDPEMWRASHLENPGDNQPGPSIFDVWKNDRWGRFARMMTKANLFDRLRAALIEHPELDVTIVSGSQDSESPLKKLNKGMVKLKDEFDGYKRKRVTQVIKPGEGHLAEIHPKQLAAMVKYIIDGSFI